MSDEELAQLKERLRIARNEFAMLDLQVKAETLRRAVEACPFKVGDEVSADHGRPRNLFCVTRIGASFGSFDLYGRQILKSGDLGKAERRIYWNVKKVGHRDLGEPS